MWERMRETKSTKLETIKLLYKKKEKRKSQWTSAQYHTVLASQCISNLDTNKINGCYVSYYPKTICCSCIYANKYLLTRVYELEWKKKDEEEEREKETMLVVCSKRFDSTFRQYETVVVHKPWRTFTYYLAARYKRPPVFHHLSYLWNNEHIQDSDYDHRNKYIGSSVGVFTAQQFQHRQKRETTVDEEIVEVFLECIRNSFDRAIDKQHGKFTEHILIG